MTGATSIPPRVAAIVLNWNGGADNLECVGSLLASGYPALEVFFVDNGSTDGSDVEVERRFPTVRLLRNRTNLGYCAGNNVGIREALLGDARYVLLLNNDMVLSPGFLQPLVETAEASRAGVVGPKIYEWGRPGRIWCAGAEIWFGENVTRLRGHGRKDDGRYNRRETVDYIPGCCLLVGREVFEKAGVLDETFFAYMEDVEFCARARSRGFRVVYEPSSATYHKAAHSTGGGYSPRRKYLNALNSVHFLRRYGTWRLWAAFVLFDVLGLPIAFVAGLPRGRGAAVVAKARGILDGFRGVLPSPRAVAG